MPVVFYCVRGKLRDYLWSPVNVKSVKEGYMNTQVVIQMLAYLTLFSNIALVVLIFFFVLSRLNKHISITRKFEKPLRSYSLGIVFIISLTATLGSLYFSEIAGFEPCKLCWFQRIFMYPLPIIIGISIWNKYKNTFNYILPLSFIGLMIAAYHYYYQLTGSSSMSCSVVGYSVSCSEEFFTYFGYITIPWMSFSAFSYIFLSSLLKKLG